MHTENYTEEMKCIEIIESHDSVNRMVRTNILDSSIDIILTYETCGANKQLSYRGHMVDA